MAAAKPKEFSIRLAPALYRRIKAAAEQRGVTINSEITHRLRLSFDFQTVDEVVLSATNSVANRIESKVELVITKAIADYFNTEKTDA